MCSSRRTLRKPLVALLAAAACMTAGAAGAAQHSGGAAHAGTSHAAVGHAQAGLHGYYQRGYGHGYYGWGAHGWVWHGCCWRGWWWGPGWWGLGLYLPVLPWYYETVWSDGYPYYYANNGYYVWNGDAGEYEQVSPPQGVRPSDTASAAPSELFAYPKGDQSTEQQNRDRDECRRWAQSVTQGPAGAPPNSSPPGAPGNAPPSPPPASGEAQGAPPSGPANFSTASPPPGSDPGAAHQAYLRAEAACLEARNYAVR